MRDKPLIEITVCLDDSTGNYQPGEMDYNIPVTTDEWIKIPSNREKLANYLYKLACDCRDSKRPFGADPEIKIKEAH